MTIKEQLQEDWKQALKSKDKPRAEILSMVKAAILHVEKTDNIKVEDAKAVEILAREVKMRRDANFEFEKGNRQDLVDKNNFEIETILGYLPKQLEEKDIIRLVEDTAKEIGASSTKDMGKLMAALKPATTGKADGKLVSSIVKDYLNRQGN
ncbi:GatB/YqeY domain-containing protein [Youngiibacter fragilis]|uniref:Aspartyl-tRNA amidotransferase subunit B n=1 Tax=Youngiibacter fragilis 232.1 TaxID=994573 RepID=V7I2T6_9CLOT|nr:GatB/YqeY domain-containing protein [Youngiibacter fragilis]ETA80173.1 aspartyl-tRNA amidotransferase subunit B [Youngiibacter fragilis 232.1]